jgi:protein-tyrosine sulfotransferase
VIKPVNVEALSKWVGHIPEDVVADMAKIAPMLLTLGYDPNANPPSYGRPDPDVSDNTLHIKANAEFWKQREKDVFDQLGGRPEPPAPAPSKDKVEEGGGGKEEEGGKVIAHADGGPVAVDSQNKAQDAGGRRRRRLR